MIPGYLPLSCQSELPGTPVSPGPASPFPNTHVQTTEHGIAGPHSLIVLPPHTLPVLQAHRAHASLNR